MINFLVILTGAIFKVNHFPGAGILLSVGIIALVLFSLPLAIINHYKTEAEGKNFTLHLVTWLTSFVVFTAILFKIMHWPFSGILITLALPFPYLVFLPVFLSASAKNNINIYNTVFVLFLLALNSVFSVLLALNVSKDRIDDSFQLSENYNKVENVIVQLSDAQNQSAVNMKIDEVLNIVDRYQNLILKQEGITPEQWKTNPENLWRPDSRGAGIVPLMDDSDLPIEALPQSLRSLIREFEKTPGYQYLGTKAPKIFNFREYTGSDQEYISRIFSDSNLAWTLIYLDGLRANLLLIRSVNS